MAATQPQTVVVPREPIDGAQLLRDMYTALNHFAMWPSEAALVTATLWVAQAHGKDEKTGLPCLAVQPEAVPDQRGRRQRQELDGAADLQTVTGR